VQLDTTALTPHKQLQQMYAPLEATALQAQPSQIKRPAPFVRKAVDVLQAARITSCVPVDLTKMKKGKSRVKIAVLDITAQQEPLQRSCVQLVVIAPLMWQSVLFAKLVHTLFRLVSHCKVNVLHVP